MGVAVEDEELPHAATAKATRRKRSFIYGAQWAERAARLHLRPWRPQVEYDDEGDGVHEARVAKLADAVDLGSTAARHKGSSPFPCTIDELDSGTSIRNSDSAAAFAAAFAAAARAPLVGAELAEALRGKLDAAILAEAWDAVKAIKARIDEVERAGVVDLAEHRRTRRGT